MMSVVSEWASPDLKRSISLLFIAPAIIIVLCFISTKKKIDAFDLLVFMFFGYLYMRSERFIALLLISGYFCGLEYSPEIDIFKVLKFDFRVQIGIYTFLSVFTISFVVLVVQTMITTGKIVVDDALISDEVVEIINEYKPQRMYNHYNLGGELIYNDIDVFIDGRADMYTNNNLEDFVDMTHVSLDENSVWKIETILDKYDFDMFVCTVTEKTQVYLLSHPEKYECIYKNDKVRIYVPIGEK
jgi:hypothetical protein